MKTLKAAYRNGT